MANHVRANRPTSNKQMSHQLSVINHQLLRPTYKVCAWSTGMAIKVLCVQYRLYLDQQVQIFHIYYNSSIPFLDKQCSEGGTRTILVPPACKAEALPTELHPMMRIKSWLFFIRIHGSVHNKQWLKYSIKPTALTELLIQQLHNCTCQLVWLTLSFSFTGLWEVRGQRSGLRGSTPYQYNHAMVCLNSARKIRNQW